MSLKKATGLVKKRWLRLALEARRSLYTSVLVDMDITTQPLQESHLRHVINAQQQLISYQPDTGHVKSCGQVKEVAPSLLHHQKEENTNGILYIYCNAFGYNSYIITI